MTGDEHAEVPKKGIMARNRLWLGVGFGLFIIITLLPTPQSLVDVVTEQGYAEHMIDIGIASSPETAAWKAKVVIALVVMAVIFFATEAMPIGAAALLIPLLGYWFKLYGPDPSDVAKAFMSDAAFFILGVLALGYAIAEVGLHSRIAALILGKVRGFKTPIFVICLSMAVLGSFISAHALAAFMAPVMAAIYYGSVKAASKGGKVEHDPVLAKMLLLALCYGLNVGGTGSPIAGARNAIMMEYFRGYGVPITFGQWMMYGFPMVPILGFAVAFYMLFRFKPRVRDLTPGIQSIKDELKEKGPMSYGEKVMAGILIFMLIAWIVPDMIGLELGLGLGGPALLAIVLPPMFGVVNWEKMLKGIAWDAWFVYIGAMGLGAFMKTTGAAYWIAHSFISMLGEFGMDYGIGLWIPVSMLSGVMTNFMSDGATTALLGPITLNMGMFSGNPAEPWASGLATAFATSFAHFLIIGTPNNVIAYGLGRYPDSGERILHATDFVKYGLPLFFISMLVMWVVTFVIVFSVVGFPQEMLATAETAIAAGSP